MKVKKAKSRNLPVFYGDANRVEILKTAQIQQASTLVVTMDDGIAAERLVQNARQDWPHVYIIARARDISHAQRLITHGANDVILETIEASLQISAVILQRLGMPELTVRQKIEHQRQSENSHQTRATAHDESEKPDSQNPSETKQEPDDTSTDT